MPAPLGNAQWGNTAVSPLVETDTTMPLDVAAWWCPTCITLPATLRTARIEWVVWWTYSPLSWRNGCHFELHEHCIAETRQVFELTVLAMRTVAHQQIRSICTCGVSRLGAWPVGTNAPTPYGASVKAMAVHLDQYQLVPLARTACATPTTSASWWMCTSKRTRRYGTPGRRK